MKMVAIVALILIVIIVAILLVTNWFGAGNTQVEGLFKFFENLLTGKAEGFKPPS